MDLEPYSLYRYVGSESKIIWCDGQYEAMLLTNSLFLLLDSGGGTNGTNGIWNLKIMTIGETGNLVGCIYSIKASVDLEMLSGDSLRPVEPSLPGASCQA